MAAPMRRNLVEGIVTAASTRSGCSGETADLGLLDRMMTTCATPLSLLGASILEQTLARGGSQVERHADSRVDNAGSRRDGVAEARQRTRFKVCTQGGGDVWRHRQDRQS
jgi:hypothetical protein